MLKSLALALTVAIFMASGFGLTPPQSSPDTARTTAGESAEALKTDRLYLPLS